MCILAAETLVKPRTLLWQTLSEKLGWFVVFTAFIIFFFITCELEKRYLKVLSFIFDPISRIFNLVLWKNIFNGQRASREEFCCQNKIPYFIIIWIFCHFYRSVILMLNEIWKMNTYSTKYSLFIGLFNRKNDELGFFLDKLKLKLMSCKIFRSIRKLIINYLKKNFSKTNN